MNEIMTMRTDLANGFAAAGAKLLDFTMTAGALAAIPNTTPQQYAVAGTLDSIQKVLPAAEPSHPQRRMRHGDRPTEPLVFEDEPTPAATSGDAPADLPADLSYLLEYIEDGAVRNEARRKVLEFARIERAAAPAPEPRKDLRSRIAAVLEDSHLSIEEQEEVLGRLSYRAAVSAATKPTADAVDLLRRITGGLWIERVAEENTEVANMLREARAFLTAPDAATKPAPLDLSRLKRYGINSDYTYMAEKPEGDYVRFADVQSLLATKPAAAQAVPEGFEITQRGPDIIDVRRPYQAPSVAVAMKNGNLAEAMLYELAAALLAVAPAAPMALEQAKAEHAPSLPDVAMPEQQIIKAFEREISNDPDAYNRPGEVIYSITQKEMLSFVRKLAAQPAEGSAQVARPEQFNAERIAHLINRLSVANRRDGWKGAAPEYSNADRERAAKEVDITERNLLDYVKSLATPAAVVRAPAELDKLSTFDPTVGGFMERRDKYKDGDYYKVEDVRALFTAAEGATPAGDALTDAARDVLAERRRQVEQEGWTAACDDEHSAGQMSRAAACYALHTEPVGNVGDYLRFWPWDSRWWKPRDKRRNLVKAGALILADIERLDRARGDKQGAQGGEA